MNCLHLYNHLTVLYLKMFMLLLFRQYVPEFFRHFYKLHMKEKCRAD